MGWKNTKDFKAYQARRSNRVAARGRELEGRIEKILQRMKTEGKIDDFIMHPPYSKEDHEGADASTIKKGVRKSFGVTISMRSWARSKKLHPDRPQFCFPLETKEETIERRILKLHEENAKPVANSVA